MRLHNAHAGIQFTSARTHPGAPTARFEGTWARGEPLPSPPSDGLEFFLVERYCLYTTHWGRLSRVRIFHHPWPLRRVERLSFTSTMLASQGLPTPREAPLMHAQGEPLRVGIWPPEQAERTTRLPTTGRRLPLVITPTFSTHPIRFWAMMRKHFRLSRLNDR